MSQRRPAAHPTSHHSSESPRSDLQPSPRPPQQAVASSEQAQDVGLAASYDPSNIPYTNGDDRSLRIPPRTLGVQSLIHPSSPSSHPLAAGPPSQPALPDIGLASGHPMAAGPYGGPPSRPGPYTFQGPPSTTSQQGTPGPYAAAPFTSDRGSPTTGHPLPALNNPRHMLSPRAPRASSLSRPPPRELDPHHSPYTYPTGPRRKRSFAESNAIPEGPPPPPPPPPSFGPPSSFGTSPSTIGARTPPPRSLSQPALLSHLPPTSDAPPQPPLPPGIGRDAQGRPALLPGQASFVGMQLNRGPPPSLPPPEMAQAGAGPPPMSMFRGAQRPVLGPGGHHMIEISPAFGEKIMVPVDMHQASKSADEKRMRNAGASARFRQRKKEKEQEMDKEIQRLQDEKRELQMQINDLQRQRDYYREDRNRLRELVRQTPSISDQAYAGPPSPSPSRSAGGSFAERSPHAAASAAPPTATQSYQEGASDPDSIERQAAMRRRTEPALEFSMPSYGSPAPQSTTPAPTALPPLPGTSVMGERLPPMRMEALPSGTATRPQQTEHPFPTFSQPPYEPWGNRPGGAPGPPGPGPPGPPRPPGHPGSSAPPDPPPEGGGYGSR